MYKSHLTSGVHIFSQEKDKKCSVSENCPNLSREHYWKAMDLELIWIQHQVSGFANIYLSSIIRSPQIFSQKKEGFLLAQTQWGQSFYEVAF